MVKYDWSIQEVIFLISWARDSLAAFTNKRDIFFNINAKKEKKEKYMQSNDKRIFCRANTRDW